MEQRMRIIEEKFKEFQGIQQKRYSHLKEYVSRLERNIDEEKIQKEASLEDKISLKEELEAKVIAYLELNTKVPFCFSKNKNSKEKNLRLYSWVS